ncbi:MAG: MFS transporter [Kiritimatiellaceae bacterium]|nr:MFS transporter [Kiritimatiellaceae bacterium]
MIKKDVSNGAEVQPEDQASRGEIIIYGMGTAANMMAGKTYALLTPLMVITLGMSPILAGMILAIKTLWDAFTDPVMATITDNANTRWGRRRPFILVGGVSLALVCLGTWLFIPSSPRTPNVEPTAVVKPAAPIADSAVVSADKAGETVSVVPVAPIIDKKKNIRPPRKSFMASMRDGIAELEKTSKEKKHLFIYLTIALMLMATAQTVFSVPYYALGIELSPSYHGRTRVVAFRSIFDKLIGFLGPWFLPFCLGSFFVDGIEGIKWLTIILASFAIPLVILSTCFTKERTKVDRARKKVNMFASIAATAKNRHFLKIASLYVVIQVAIGLFAQLGLFINIYYVFGGDKQAGAIMSGKVGSFAALLGIPAIPLITWICKKYQKHNALRLAILMTSAGCVLNWFCLNPAYPELQYILPFFFSLGISSTYTVLGTMMADVTDIDELNTGSRREGMFGAVMAWMMKAIASIQALAAGAVLVATGFNIELGVNQLPGVILNMRLLFSFAPAILLLFSLFILYRYPLTKKRMEEIKEILAERKRVAAAAQG